MAGTGLDIGPSQSPSKSYALSGKIMLTSIVVLFAVVLFLFLLHLYARWYLLRVRHRLRHRSHHHHRRSRRNRPTHVVFYVDTDGTLSAPTGGLDTAVLKSLPVFVFSPETHRSLLECAVCLSEFEDGEEGRNLPKCHHSFHSECIDMWFHTHSTCPLCRTPVEPVEPDLVISVAEPEPGCVHDGESEANATTSFGDRRKELDMRIEVPSRSELVTQDDFRMPSPASQGFRSPGSRLMSLKKMLSMSRKSPASSPSSGVGMSCLPGGAESDPESPSQELTQGVTLTTTPR